MELVVEGTRTICSNEEEKMAFSKIKAIHHVNVWLDFIDSTLNERSSEFDSLELDEVKIKCTLIAAKISTIIKRRG